MLLLSLYLSMVAIMKWRECVMDAGGSIAKLGALMGGYLNKVG
jgi:hypothetical protein